MAPPLAIAALCLSLAGNLYAQNTPASVQQALASDAWFSHQSEPDKAKIAEILAQGRDFAVKQSWTPQWDGLTLGQQARFVAENYLHKQKPNPFVVAAAAGREGALTERRSAEIVQAGTRDWSAKPETAVAVAATAGMLRTAPVEAPKRADPSLNRIDGNLVGDTISLLERNPLTMHQADVLFFGIGKIKPMVSTLDGVQERYLRQPLAANVAMAETDVQFDNGIYENPLYLREAVKLYDSRKSIAPSSSSRTRRSPTSRAGIFSSTNSSRIRTSSIASRSRPRCVNPSGGASPD